MCSIITSLKSHLLELNLFKSGTENEQTVLNERRSTRLYLFLLIISILILTFYYTITPFTETITLESPSFVKYSIFAREASLQCACSKVAIKYETFLQIKPTYHEVCQSDFLSNHWIHHLSLLYDQSWNHSISSDFRRIALFQFETLRSLCELVQETLTSRLQSFHQTDFIQSQLVEETLFRVQINSFVSEFINSSSKMFSRTLHFIQNTTAQSLLMAGASLTSVQPSFQVGFILERLSVPFPGSVYTFLDNATCICSSSTATNCMGTATFRNESVAGFQTGCYMINVLLKSTLEILYNQSLIDTLTNSSKDFQKLNSSLSNKTMETLLSQMLVDHWSNKTSYEEYFTECAPDLCQYIISQRYGIFHIVTLMIGLFGGLSSALRILAPFTIEILRPMILRCITRRRMHTIQPVAVRTTPGRIE
jgi:hypothetical protein